MRRAFLLAFLCVLLLFVAVTPAYAQEGDGNQAIFGRDFVLRSGETIRGDLFVMGGNVTVEKGAYVRGDLAVLGGDAEIAGEVRGDVAALGGDVHLASSAEVHGGLVVLGGRLTEEEGAVVRGDRVQGLPFPFPFRPTGPFPSLATPTIRVGGERPFVVDFVFGLFRAVIVSVGLAVLGVLVVLFVPDHTRRVGRAVVEAPLASVGVGVLTIVVAAMLLPLMAVISALLVVVCVGIFGFPLIALLVLALAAAWVFGWIAIGWLVGERLLQATGVKRVEPWIAAGLGVLLLSLLGAVPCVGFLFSAVAGFLGLGAVVLTRLGTQRYPMPFVGAPPPEFRGPPAPPPAPLPPEPARPESEVSLVVPELAEELATPESEGPVVVEAEVAPEKEADDLTVIYGIGPVFAAELRKAGIRTFAQLASASPEQVVEAVKGERAIEVTQEEVEGWIEEAGRLAAEGASD